MRARKDAIRQARALFDACLVDGEMDESRVRKVVERVGAEKPRGYLGILEVFVRLVRLQSQSRDALVESAQELTADQASQVTAGLMRKYGSELKMKFEVNPELIGGMRVKIGNDVWDGSVRNRLQLLKEAFN